MTAFPTRSGPTKTFRDVMMATDPESLDLAYKLKNELEYRNIPIVLVTGFTQRMAEIGPERFQHILSTLERKYADVSCSNGVLASVTIVNQEQNKPV